VVPWLRQRLASFEDASLQGMAGKKKTYSEWGLYSSLDVG
jgi:hypothetical protein